MKKIILIFFAFVNLAFAYNYDDVVIKAQASIFPKIILLDKKLKNKLIEGEIIYTIVYDKSNYDTALRVSKFINENYNGYFDKYKYKINLVEFSNFSSDTTASALYVLNLDNKIKKVADIAKTKGIISFSYDINNLKDGLMFSLVMEKSTVLYLEKENLYNKKIDFVDSLLQIVKFTHRNNLHNKMLYNNLNSNVMYAKTITDIFMDIIYN